MLLTDPRLDFARPLVRHWSDIRGDALVPAKERIAPAKLTGVLPFITIVDVSKPGTVAVRLAGTGLRSRYGQEITQANWLDFIPPERRKLADVARGLLIATPCGIYYRFRIAGTNVKREAETLSLPLRTEDAATPSMMISVTRDVAIEGNLDAAATLPAQLEELFTEFVDIGAGVPDIRREP